MRTDMVTTPSGFTAVMHWDEGWDDEPYLLTTTADDGPSIPLRLDFRCQRTGHYGSVELDPETVARLLELAVQAWDPEMAAGRPRELSPSEGWQVLVMARQQPYVSDDREYAWLVWELAPFEEEQPADPVDQAVIGIRMGIVELESRTGPMPVDLSDLGPVDDACFDWRQRYGPLTPWVVANARAFVSCVESDALAARMLAVSATQDWRSMDMVLHTLARDFRRNRGLEQAAELATRLTEQRQRRPGWWAVVRRNALDLYMPVEESEEYLNQHLRRFLRTSLSALVLEDRLDERQRIPALGAWRTLLAVDECDAGQPWRCTPDTADRVRHLLRDWDEDRLVDALQLLDQHSDPVQQELRLRLVGSTLTAPTAPPPPAEVVGDGLRETVRFRGGRSIVDELSRLVAALSEPPWWIDAEEVSRQRRLLQDLFGVSWT